jgi:hypothetical protein
LALSSSMSLRMEAEAVELCFSSSAGSGSVKVGGRLGWYFRVGLGLVVLQVLAHGGRGVGFG